MSTTLTFDQIERNADRTLAFVLWAKHVKNMAIAAGGMAVLDQIAKSLVNGLSHSKEHTELSDEQATELAKNLQELHSQLDFMLRRNTVVQWRRNVLFARSLKGLHTSAADLADIIEDLVLSCSPEFRTILVDCVRALPSRSAEAVGQM